MLAVCAVLDAQLPPGCRYRKPRGGYYIWVHLPEQVNAREFAAWSEREYQSTALPGDVFATRPGDFTHCLRISVAFHSQPALESATTRLCEAMRTYLTSPPICDNDLHPGSERSQF
jgi:DNA-binding transcriptional MocR family regulator